MLVTIYEYVSLYEYVKNRTKVIKSNMLKVHWKFANGDGFTTYPEKLNGLLENAFQSKKGHFKWKEDTGEMYRVTFNTMKETTDQDRIGVAVEREEIGGKYVCVKSCCGYFKMMTRIPFNQLQSAYVHGSCFARIRS